MISKKKRLVIIQRDGCVCLICKKFFGIYWKSMTVDHVIPTSRGGTSKKYNLVAMCKECNVKKGNVLSENFIKLHNLLKKNANRNANELYDYILIENPIDKLIPQINEEWTLPIKVVKEKAMTLQPIENLLEDNIIRPVTYGEQLLHKTKELVYLLKKKIG